MIQVLHLQVSASGCLMWVTCGVVSSLCVCAQLCLTLCILRDCSLPGSSVVIFQARILEWVAFSYSRGSS